MHQYGSTPGRRRRGHFVRTALLVAAMLFAPGAALLASEPVREMTAQRFETQFLKSMPDHHLMAIEMSRVCLDKTQRGELRTLCQQIIDVQSREIDLMGTWLSNWYALTVTPTIDREGQMMLERMRALSVPDFEKMYLQMMIRHHWMATSEAGRCVERAHDLHDDLEGLCEGMIEDQVDEIRELREMLCTLYGNCNYRSDGDLHPQP